MTTTSDAILETIPGLMATGIMVNTASSFLGTSKRRKKKQKKSKSFI